MKIAHLKDNIVINISVGSIIDDSTIEIPAGTFVDIGYIWDGQTFQATYKPYKELRSNEYPPLTELADALYWNSKGDSTLLEAYYEKCEIVKLKYPKD